MGKSSFRFGAAGRAAGGRLLLIWAGLAAIFVVNPDPEQPGGGAAARAAGGGGRECACARGRAPGAPRGGAPGPPASGRFSSCFPAVTTGGGTRSLTRYPRAGRGPEGPAGPAGRRGRRGGRSRYSSAGFASRCRPFGATAPRRPQPALGPRGARRRGVGAHLDR